MKQSTKKYLLDKKIWTEKDFKNMGWHDCPIYAISFGDNFKLLFDIDYIFQWVLAGKKYKFWVAPCTLVFENVHDIHFGLELSTAELEIDDIKRDNPRRPQNADYVKRDTEFDWTIETLQGHISFKSMGYKQYVRQAPKFLSRQIIGLKARGDVSFLRNSYSV